MKYKKLKDKIVYFEDAIDDPYELLDNIEKINNEKLIHHIIDAWKPWFSGDKDHIYGERKFVFGKNLKESTGLEKNIVEILENTMNKSARQYAEIFNISAPIELSTNFVINKYNTGEKMGSHVDWNIKNNTLEYSFVVYLNDNYEGGEIYWPNHKVLLKPKAGSLVIFPSKEPYQHSVKEITKGNKIFIPHFWHT